MGTFFIADDSPAKRMMLKGVLKHVHWDGEILEATTTDDAKRMIDAHPEIMAAFIDYQMPSENGPAVIRYLREKIPAVRVALVSASDRDDYRAEAKAAGAEAYICTSDPQDLLMRRFMDLLDVWRMT